MLSRRNPDGILCRHALDNDVIASITFITSRRQWQMRTVCTCHTVRAMGGWAMQSFTVSEHEKGYYHFLTLDL